MDPRLQALLDSVSRLAPHIDMKASAAQARAAFWRTAQRLEADAPALQDRRALTVNGAAGPLDARLYTPFAAGAAGPGLVYFHGGGFVMGDLDSHEMLCRRLAAAAHARVLSVAYRLAPENRFPAAVDDAEAAARWAFANAGAIGVDPARIAVGGDSAGGNLTAVVAQALRREPDCRPAAQMLIYPCTQMVTMTPSQLKFREGYAVTQAAQDFFKDKYLARREDAYDVRCSPLLENDLAGLPPTLCITAGFDPLLDEAKAYADKLAAAGVPVTHRHYASQPHGFFNMTAISAPARDAIEDAGRWLAQALA
ncbi:MAG: alpha/beta hydrolase fold domain-containing protein [Alphaproteobacteria bacterium]|nr:alpha/beta hydrolase fold domain-containing protein [Alphaproteobacteria bacterium]